MNSAFNKISTRTLDAPPKELLEAISSISQLKGEKQLRWSIHEKTLTIEGKGDSTNSIISK